MNNNIEKLVKKSVYEQLSIDDEITISNWLNEREENKKIYNNLQLLYTYNLILDIKDGTPNSRLWFKISKKIESRVYSRYIISTISICSALVLFTFLVYNKWSNNSQYTTNLNITYYSPNVVVDTIIDHRSGTVRGYKETEKLSDAGISNFAIAENGIINAPKQSFTTLYVLPRETLAIVLEDSTKVWLNGDSKLTYPNKFTEKTREVELIGEAFFSVKSDKERPFIVKSKGIESMVIGTEINVQAYKNSNYATTTLFNGKVKVNGVDIKCGESATKLDNIENLVINKANLHELASWRRGEFYFENASLDKIMEQISIWYEKQTIYESESVKSERFTLIFPRNKDLMYVIKLLTNTNKVKFKLMGDEIYVNDVKK